MKRTLNRLLNVMLALVMTLGLVPPAALAALAPAEAEALALQMLELGLVGEDGTLIESTVFELDGGPYLASLTELRDYLAGPDADPAKTARVWGSGGTATVEQLAQALSIEDQIGALAGVLNGLAARAGTPQNAPGPLP